MIVVADAGPVIYLDGIGKLDLLHALYGPVLVPRQVFDEVVDVPIEDLVYAALQSVIDSGEAAAIALATRAQANVILMDDRAGRLAAQQLGLLVRGTLAILVEAKKRGHVDAVKPLIAEMQAAGFRAAPTIVDAILKLASEA